ncbi:MAG: DUF805 domain-containing protein [Pseudomonadota bacterium]
MGITGVLFNPNGRIAPNDFWRGIIVLVGYLIVSNVLTAFLPPPVPSIFGLLFYLLPYPYLCVFGKRLHDSGRSAWWFVLIFFAFIATLMITVMTLPGWSDVMKAFEDPNVATDQQAMNELMQETFSTPRVAIQFMGAIFGFNLVAGYLVARLPSNPETNQHGPPTQSVSGTFS